VGQAGDLYVTEYANDTVRKLRRVGTNWVTTTIAGMAGASGSDDGTNNAARFNGLNGVTVDDAGNLYVAEFGSFTDPQNTVRKLTAVGTNWVSSTIAGVAGVSGSTDGINTGTLFSGPVCVAVDRGTNVYVTDWGNHTIRKLAPVGTDWVSSTIAGVAGISGSTDGTNNDALFNNPMGIALDSVGNLFVSEFSNHTIRKLTPVGTNWVSSTIAGQAENPGSADGTNGFARFNNPFGVAVDNSGKVYVADNQNSTIRLLTPVGTDWVSITIGGLAGHPGSGNGTNSAARFSAPAGVAVDSAGNVYVADDHNNTVSVGVPVSAPLPQPTFQAIAHTNQVGGQLILFTWSAVPGLRYQLQSTSDLSSTNWVNLGSYVAIGATIQAEDMLQNGHNFYRLLVVP
jgi:secreted PhoX family phosphatase